MTIYSYKIGSNQYQKRVKTPTFGPILATVTGLGLLASVILPIGPDKNTQFLKQFSFGKTNPVVLAAELNIAGTSAQIKEEPTLENIVAYITKVFEPEGKHIVVRAINCFYSESGLRPDAVNTSNSNGTVDRGIAQINSIWKMKPEDAHNYRKNIDKAYEIYKRSGSFRPWYGKACN